MKLLLYILLLCPVICGAQNIHKKDLLGKWYMQRMVANGDVVIDRADVAAGVATSLKKMKVQNPDYTAADSLNLVSGASERIKVLDSVYVAFYEDGRLEMTGFSGGGHTINDKPNAGTYKLDEQTGILTFTQDGLTNKMKVSLRDNILMLTVDEDYMKMSMEWKRK